MFHGLFHKEIKFQLNLKQLQQEYIMNVYNALPITVAKVSRFGLHMRTLSQKWREGAEQLLHTSDSAVNCHVYNPSFNCQHHKTNLQNQISEFLNMKINCVFVLIKILYSSLSNLLEGVQVITNCQSSASYKSFFPVYLKIFM